MTKNEFILEIVKATITSGNFNFPKCEQVEPFQEGWYESPQYANRQNADLISEFIDNLNYNIKIFDSEDDVT